MKVAVLTGGGGGAKLVDGLAAVLAPAQLSVIVNTGDDFTHLGLAISPDVDSILYTLGSLIHDRGWGRAGDTFTCLEAVRALGGETWFQLGDRDLAMHLVRTALLAGGARLTDVTRLVAQRLDIAHAVLPMSDAAHPTWIETEGGALPFQRWFVAERARPAVRAIHYRGEAAASPEVVAALDDADVVVLPPSNPLLSIGPILSVAGVRERLQRTRVVAVSPLIGARTVSGPLARMLGELALGPPSVATLAEFYGDLVQTWVVDPGDVDALRARQVVPVDVVMTDRPSRARLAEAVLRCAL